MRSNEGQPARPNRAAGSYLLAHRVRDKALPPQEDLARYASKLESSGIRVIDVGPGQPDFPTPQHICDAALRALSEGYTTYTPPEGLPVVRQAVSQVLTEETGVDADPYSEILITTGTTLGLYMAIMALTNRGDDVLIPDPSFGEYQRMVELAEGRPVFVPMARQGDHFCLPPEEIERRITPGARVLILNTPNNPTGAVYTQQELEGISEVVCRHGLYVIADEVYSRILFDHRRHISIRSLSSEMRSRTVVVNSLSKTYAMTGWRVGYTIAPATVTRAMNLICRSTARCATAFVQMAAVAALQGCQDAVETMRSAYETRRDLVWRLMRTTGGIGLVPPEGTFYFWIDISRFATDSTTFARNLLEAEHVLVVPGSYFGPRGEGHIRISLTKSEASLIDAANHIQRFLLRHKESAGGEVKLET